MAKVLSFFIILVFALPAMAGELEDLTNDFNKLNREYVEIEGVIKFHNQLIVESGKRAGRLDEIKADLREKIQALTKSITRLKAVVEEKPSE